MIQLADSRSLNQTAWMCRLSRAFAACIPQTHGKAHTRGHNLGVIVVRVCEPVFQNLPHSYTWPLEKWTHSCTWSSKILSYSYTALWFLVPIYCWLLDKYHSEFIEYQENKQPRKISEGKICVYTWGIYQDIRKMGPFYLYTDTASTPRGDFVQVSGVLQTMRQCSES